MVVVWVAMSLPPDFEVHGVSARIARAGRPVPCGSSSPAPPATSAPAWSPRWSATSASARSSAIARRRPAESPPKTRCVAADVAADPLEPLFAGADAVIHLAWLIQPSRDEAALEAHERRRARGACSTPPPRPVRARSCTRRRSARTRPGPKDRRGRRVVADRGHPDARSTRATRPPPSARSTRSRPRSPALRVVRLRPGLIFKRERRDRDPAAVRRPVPALAARASAPDPDRARPARAWRFQAVHADDVARRLPAGGARRPRRAAPTTSPPSPCSTSAELCRLLGARPLRLHAGARARARERELAPAPPADAAGLARHGHRRCR